MAAAVKTVTAELSTNIRTFIWVVIIPIEVLMYGSYAILIDLSKVDGRLPYLASSYELCIEVLKLSICFFILSFEEYFFTPEKKTMDYPRLTLHSVFPFLIKDKGDKGEDQDKMVDPSSKFPIIPLSNILPFAVPALCYSFNNNLAFILQRYMDPATFTVLENFKIVTTSMLYRFIIKRELTHKQWAAVGMLTVGSALHSYSALQSKSVSLSESHLTLMGLTLLGLFCFVSGFASVFQENLLKKDMKLPLYYQSIFLYAFGVIFNLLLWLGEATEQARGTDGDFSSFHLFNGFSIYTWILIGAQVIRGLIMSLIMKYMNNMVKVFVVAAAPLVTTVFAYLFFSLHIQLEFEFSVALVCMAVVLYNF